MGDRLSEHVSVRFPDQTAAIAEQLARRDGMSTSAWVRRLIERELAHREGKCPTCGAATDTHGPGPT